MKLLLALATLAAGAAFADTTVNFGPATACPTYCTGFTTDTGGKLDWLNATYALSSPGHTLLSFNSQTYSGNTAATFVDQVDTHRIYDVDGVLQQQGGTATLVVHYRLEYWTTRVVSGRDAGHLTTHRLVDFGTLVLQ